MAKMLEERPWIWSSHVWNMFDFGCAARKESGVAARNNKGLMTMDRKTKRMPIMFIKRIGARSQWFICAESGMHRGQER